MSNEKIARLKAVADGLRRIQEFESARYLDEYAAQLAQPAQTVNVVVKPTQRCKLCHPETCACPDYQVVVNFDMWTTGDLEHCNEIARKVRALTIASRHVPTKG